MFVFSFTFVHFSAIIHHHKEDDHKPQPLIYHIDVNSADLSGEAAELLRQDPDAPDIRSFPSVIGGSEKTRHGIVLAKSPSAAALGVCTGEPLAQARRK